ncbi:MAG: tetratricopeptide repeat protein [Bacteroidia bacterium]|nr:tetratricopeptide repeat protein [Bacteroidia bacterium]
MKIRLFLFLFCLSACLGASPVTDSLSRLIAAEQDGMKKARLYCTRGDQLTFIGQYDEAMEDYSSAIRLWGKDTLSEEFCNATFGIGRCFNLLGNRAAALHHLQRSLTIAKMKGYHHEQIQSLIMIGSVFLESPQNEKSIQYFEEAERVAHQRGKEDYMGAIKTYQANYYYTKKDFEKALSLYFEVYKMTENSPGHYNAGTLGNIGNVYIDLGQYELGKSYQWRAIKGFRNLNDIQGQTICLSSLGELYLKEKKTDSSEYCFRAALQLAQEMNSWEDFIEIHEGLSSLYKIKGDHRRALEHYELFKIYSDSVAEQGNAEKLTETELTYKFLEKQREQEIMQKAKDEVVQEQMKRQRFISWAAAGGALLTLVILIMVYRISRDRKESNIRLSRFNEEILFQKNVIEEKNKEITDSINYAERIQKALLNSEGELKKNIPHYFIFNRPRDIVSGDFYWAAEKFGKLFIAVADCTGHGVPGAFMSMIGVSMLNELVVNRGMHDPGKILNKLREEVIVALNPEGSKEEQKDGMDMVLMVLDRDQLSFAAANNPLWLIRNGKLEEFKGDKMPVGIHAGEMQAFRTQQVRLLPGDSVYAFSDGYADQFGGPSGKKFKYKPFADLLLRIHDLSFQEQKTRLDIAFNDWKKDLQQVDDVLVMGFRLQ